MKRRKIKKAKRKKRKNKEEQRRRLRIEFAIDLYREHLGHVLVLS